MKQMKLTCLATVALITFLDLNSAMAMMAYNPESSAVLCPQLVPGTYICRPTSPRNIPPISIQIGYTENSGGANSRMLLLGVEGKDPVKIPCGPVKQENIYCDAKQRLADPAVAQECQKGIGANYLKIALESSSNSARLNTRLDVMTQDLRSNKIVSFLTTNYKIDVLSPNSFRFFASYSGNLTTKEDASSTDVLCRP